MTMVRIMSVCAQSSCAIRYYPDKKLGGTALVPPLYKTCWFFVFLHYGKSEPAIDQFRKNGQRRVGDIVAVVRLAESRQ